MLSSTQIIFSAVFGSLLLKRPVMRHGYLGCAFTVVGFIVVVYSQYVRPKPVLADFDTESNSIVLGVILTIGYLIFHSLQGCCQQIILQDRAIYVQRMVGLEGMFGLLWSFFFIVIASLINCPNEQVCELAGTVADPVEAVYQILHHQKLLFFCATSIVAVIALNLVALQLAGLVSAVYKAIWMTVGVSIVWVTSPHPDSQYFSWTGRVLYLEGSGAAFGLHIPYFRQLHV
jgi:hypothetical protein